MHVASCPEGKEVSGESTYKGDSPGKKLVRLSAWLNIMAVSEALHIPYLGALVLAGEGGDLGVLRGLGFDMSTVSAVDRDPFLVEWCKHHYPEIQAKVGDLADLCGGGDDSVQYNTAHIDFCGGLSVENIKTTARVMAGANSHPAVFAVTMLKGRESMCASGLMEGVKRGDRRRLQLKARKRGNVFAEHIFSGRRLDLRMLLDLERARLRSSVSKHFQEKGDWDGTEEGDGQRSHALITKGGDLTSMGTAMVRTGAMQRCVEYLWDAIGADRLAGLPDGESLHLQFCGAQAYHSGTKRGGGTPFVTATYVLYRSCQQDQIVPMIAGVMENGMSFGSLNLESCLDAIKPTIAELAKGVDHGDVADMFGIKKASIPAIMAHRTMGTYKGEPTLLIDRSGKGLRRFRGWGE